jgi:hypothetical protein
MSYINRVKNNYFLSAVIAVAVCYGVFKGISENNSKPIDAKPAANEFKNTNKNLPNFINVVYKSRDGKIIRGIAKQDQLNELIESNVMKINTLYSEISNDIKVSITNEINKVFNEIRVRVPVFADWHYSYYNQYYILINSTVFALYNLSHDNIIDQIRNKNIEILSANYINMVLKPEITDYKLNKIFRDTESYISKKWLDIGVDLDEKIQILMAKNTDYLIENKNYGEIDLEWESLTPFFKMPPDLSVALGGIRGVSMAVAGGVAGKIVGQELGNVLLARTVNKASIAMAGGSVGGIIGVTVGLATSVAIDWLLTKGTEVFSRSQFELDVYEAVSATQNNIFDIMIVELNKYNEASFSEYLKAGSM